MNWVEEADRLVNLTKTQKWKYHEYEPDPDTGKMVKVFYPQILNTEKKRYNFNRALVNAKHQIKCLKTETYDKLGKLTDVFLGGDNKIPWKEQGTLADEYGRLPNPFGENWWVATETQNAKMKEITEEMVRIAELIAEKVIQ